MQTSASEALVIRIQNGEDLLHELWERMERLAAWYANRLARRAPRGLACAERDDLYQCGYPALARAVRSWDSSRRGTFGRYFLHCMQTEIRRFSGCRGDMRKRDPLSRPDTLSLNAPSGRGGAPLGDTVAQAFDPIAEAEERIWAEQLHEALEEALGKLDEKLAGLIRMRFFDGCTLREAGELLGADGERDARRLEAMALRRLRRPQIRDELARYMDGITPFYMHVSARRFLQTRTSAVEALVIWRERAGG